MTSGASQPYASRPGEDDDGDVTVVLPPPPRAEGPTALVEDDNADAETSVPGGTSPRPAWRAPALSTDEIADAATVIRDDAPSSSGSWPRAQAGGVAGATAGHDEADPPTVVPGSEWPEPTVAFSPEDDDLEPSRPAASTPEPGDDGDVTVVLSPEVTGGLVLAAREGDAEPVTSVAPESLAPVEAGDDGDDGDVTVVLSPEVTGGLAPLWGEDDTGAFTVRPDESEDDGDVTVVLSPEVTGQIPLPPSTPLPVPPAPAPQSPSPLSQQPGPPPVVLAKPVPTAPPTALAGPPPPTGPLPSPGTPPPGTPVPAAHPGPPGAASPLPSSWVPPGAPPYPTGPQPVGGWPQPGAPHRRRPMSALELVVSTIAILLVVAALVFTAIWPVYPRQGQPPAALLARLPSPQPSGASVPRPADTTRIPAAMVGTWAGTVTQQTQPIAETYGLLLMISDGPVGGLVGTGLYTASDRSWACTSTMTLVSGGATVTVNEDFGGSPDCLGGSVTLRLDPSGRLVYHFDDVGYGAGDAVLTRRA